MLNKFAASRIRRQEGATAVEYGLIAGLIAVAIIATLLLIGPQLQGVFQKVETGVASANSAK
jgi:pilus assembly protein Flp/PilA